VIRSSIFVAIAAAVLGNAVAVSAARTIDLDDPGNLEALQRVHPDHYTKIERILAEVPRRPPAESSVATWMRTEFEARDIRYQDLIMTSLPPKKRLEFSLDTTTYRKTITLSGWQPFAQRIDSVPAK